MEKSPLLRDWETRCRMSRVRALDNAPILTRECATAEQAVAVLRNAVEVRRRPKRDRRGNPTESTKRYSDVTDRLEREADWLEAELNRYIRGK